MRLLSGVLAASLAIALADVSAAPRNVPVTAAPAGAFDVALGRAAYEQAMSRPRGVVAALAPFVAFDPWGPGSDRAAFLLAHAYAELGDREAARRVAAAVAGRTLARPYADWFARFAVLDGSAAPPAGARVADRDSTGSAVRRAVLDRASAAMDAFRWEDAASLYAQADADRARERAILEALLAATGHDSLWAAWRAGEAPGDAWTLDATPVLGASRALARAAADLSKTPQTTMPEFASPRVSSARSLLPPPSREEWNEVSAVERERDAAVFGLDAARDALADEEARLGSARGYLDFGTRKLAAERAALAAREARLDSLSRSVAALRAELDSVRTEAGRRVVVRAKALERVCDMHLVWLGEMRRFHVQGPGEAGKTPAGLVGPDSVTRAEIALTSAVRDYAARMAADAPGLITRSFESRWRTGLVDRIATQLAGTRDLLAAAGRTAAAVDSARKTLVTSPEREALARRVQALGQRTDSLTVAVHVAEESAAGRAIRRALTCIDDEREAIDYGLAAATYAASVRRATADSASRAIVRRADGAAQPTSDALAEDPEASRWRAQSIAYTEAFLERHPASFARGEMRFRLADLLLVDARQSFRGRMEAFLAAQERGRRDVELPVIDPARPLALYRAILAEDSSFTHRDAVLFNAGSILAEQGNTEAGDFFGRLVREDANSPFAQEAWLRIGDLAFDRGDPAAAVDPYERAAGGADTTIRIVALYKEGWAEFDRDRFVPAADAFRRVLDLYDASPGARAGVDVRKESEAFLTHTFARAGGADAFAAYFDRTGERPWAPRILSAMGHQFRRFSLLPQAARSDSLFVERYPDDPSALASAQRVIETHERDGRPASALSARARYADRFAPGRTWASKQSSDSLRAAGSAFARGSWAVVAFDRHARAVASGSRADWQEALRVYRVLLDGWPADDAAPAFALDAGEASSALGDDPAALGYYAQAARTGRDSIPEIACRQAFGVHDRAYDRSRQGRAIGDPALAREVIAAGDTLLSRFPSHRDRGDVRWRQANLAYAHGWDEQAATAFAAVLETGPAPRRAALAANLRAEALFRLARYADAGEAFEVARRTAAAAGVDSLVRRATAALPVCAYRRAEASVAADSSAYATHAKLFDDVAVRWPAYELAPRAQYRAGLAWRRAHAWNEAVAAMEAVITRFPKSEFVKDATLQIAATWKEAGENAKAADAALAFAQRFPDDEGAGDAILGAADLYAAAGRTDRADAVRLDYVAAHPGDVATSMAILEDFAKRELAAGAPGPRVAQYMTLAAAHADLASRPLVAEVRYREAETKRPAYETLRFTLPLDKSIAAKRKSLDALVASYRKVIDFGVATWAQASAFRIGEALVGFGAALDASEHPAGLAGEDRVAYDDVLFRESRTFYDKGEGVWSDLLSRASRDSVPGEWLERSQAALWKRLGDRFLFKAEVVFPTIAAKPSPPAAPTDTLAVAVARAAADPADAYWPFRIAELCAARDSLAAAEAALATALERQPLHAPSLALAAKLDFAAGRYTHAIERLAPLRTVEANWTEAERAVLMEGLALAYDALDRSDLGREVAPPGGAGDDASRTTVAVYRALRNETAAKAAEIAAGALKRDSGSAVNQNNFGVSLLRTGDPKAAREAFDRARAIDPWLAGPYYNLAILEKFYLFDDGAAERWLATYRERSTDDPDGLFGRIGGAAADAAHGTE